MNLEEVYEHYGNITKAAEAVNVTRQTFHNWMRNGFIPYIQQQRYEKLSGGVLKAEKFPSAKPDPDFYIPKFRYYSDSLGMCEVHSLTWITAREPRIRYYDPANYQMKFTSFDITYLMQVTFFTDTNRIPIFEKDILMVDGEKYTFDNIWDDDLFIKLRSAKKVLIIGNKFEGIRNGHKRSK